MRYLCLICALLLCACAPRWDPPNFNQSLCQPVCGIGGQAAVMPSVPLEQMK